MDADQDQDQPASHEPLSNQKDPRRIGKITALLIGAACAVLATMSNFEFEVVYNPSAGTNQARIAVKNEVSGDTWKFLFASVCSLFYISDPEQAGKLLEKLADRFVGSSRSGE